MLCGLYGDHYCGTEEDDHVRRVLLQQSPGRSLGLTVRGGRELGTGLYVCGLDRGGHAQLQGLRVGDRILRVNDVDFRRISHQMAVEVIRSTSRMIVCVTSLEAHRMPRDLSIAARPALPRPILTRPVVARPMVKLPVVKTPRRTESRMIADAPDVHRIKIYAEPDGYLGLSFRGGVDWAQRAVISDLDTASPATRAGLMVGDIILKINGTDISTLTHMEIVRKATERLNLSLLVRRPKVTQRNNTLIYGSRNRNQRKLRRHCSHSSHQRTTCNEDNPVITNGVPCNTAIKTADNRSYPTNPPIMADEPATWLVKLISQTIRLNLDYHLDKKISTCIDGGYLDKSQTSGPHLGKNDVNSPIEISSSLSQENSEGERVVRRQPELCHWNIPPTSMV